MAFDIEIASNEKIDTGREASILGDMDSRRSLSEVLNEGDLDNVDDAQVTSINNKVSSRPNKFQSSSIDTILEDDKENLSSTVQGESDKG